MIEPETMFVIHAVVDGIWKVAITIGLWIVFKELMKLSKEAKRLDINQDGILHVLKQFKGWKDPE